MTLEIPRTADAQGVAEASAEVVAAVADGLITPEEGQVLSQILEARRRAIETSEHEQRLEALEKTLESRREST
jgi:tellurite resistance protein